MLNDRVHQCLHSHVTLISGLLVISAIGCMSVPIAFGLGYVETNPAVAALSVLCSTGTELACDVKFNDQMPIFGSSAVLYGYLLWALICMPAPMFFRILTDVAKAPSWAAYKESQKLKAEKAKLEIEIANREVERGTLEGLQILPGGFLSSDRTMLETSTGFIEVRGVVSGIKKGSRVWQVRDNIHLEGSRRHFSTY